MAELGNGLNHVTAIRQELEVLVIIANRWVTEFLVVQLRRASPRDFKVRFGEINVHSGDTAKIRTSAIPRKRIQRQSEWQRKVANQIAWRIYDRVRLLFHALFNRLARPVRHPLSDTENH